MLRTVLFISPLFKFRRVQVFYCGICRVVLCVEQNYFAVPDLFLDKQRSASVGCHNYFAAVSFYIFGYGQGCAIKAVGSKFGQTVKAEIFENFMLEKVKPVIFNVVSVCCIR